MRERTSADPFPMAQTAAPEGPGLPCSPEQALALYQLIFRRPAGLGQLQAALRQVRDGRGCLPGLELPTVLLQMERSRRAQEKLLWDLELLTGLGLGLFWPPWTWFYGQRNQAQPSQPCGRMGGESEQLNSRLHPPHQAGNALSQNHQPLEGGQTTDPRDSDGGEVGSDADSRQEESLSRPAEAAPGASQELNLASVSGLQEAGNLELKGEETPRGPASRSPQGRELTQEAPGAPQDPSQGLGSGVGPETPTLLGIEDAAPHSPRRPSEQGPGRPRSGDDSTPPASAVAPGGAQSPLPGPSGAPGSPPASADEALRRLLELRGAAGRRRRRDRERQRLRVLERLRIAGNRHRRVHPLGLPLSPAQLPPQEDSAGRRHLLRERLQQVHQERTRRLRALVVRNTKNFQELLSPGAEEPEPGD